MALPKFCEKCETMHSAGRPCDARGLKAVTSRKPVPVAQPVEHPTFNGLAESSNLSGHTIPRPMAELVDAVGLSPAGENRGGSIPSGPTIDQPVAQSGSASTLGVEGRQFKSDPADQILEARSLDGPKLSAHNGVIEGSNPSVPTKICRGIPGRGVAASASLPVTAGKTNRDDEVVARQGAVLHSSIESSRPPQSFDRIEYQRNYMRDRPLALAEGLTVKAWRVKHGKE